MYDILSVSLCHSTEMLRKYCTGRRHRPTHVLIIPGFTLCFIQCYRISAAYIVPSNEDFLPKVWCISSFHMRATRVKSPQQFLSAEFKLQSS
jgi:hypothetical protein